jgi:UDP-N-acetyl-2-amino-2-deoxyglucuronate dehydrogenase
MPRHVEAINQINGKIVDIINDFRSPDAWKEIVKKPEVDCIVVLTPNDLHFEIAKKAAEEGKIVLCEKPLAIRSEHVKELSVFKDIYTVLQLRHHPEVREIKKIVSFNQNYEIKMDISVYRDSDYYKSWKGKKERSGGILFNLGVHYFDLLIYLFGAPIDFRTKEISEKNGEGIIKGNNYVCSWRISTNASRKEQKRIFEINGRNYNFSSKDNLSYENLHRFVYRDLLEGKGVTPDEAFRSINLIENLYDKY